MKRWSVLSLALFLVLAAAGFGCSSGNRAGDFTGLVTNLESQGATVVEDGQVTQPFFDITGRSITVDGQTVQVFEYADETAMKAEAEMVSEDGSTIGTSSPSWISDPHFYESGRILVLYVGTDTNVMDKLEKALGPQFAGR